MKPKKFHPPRAKRRLDKIFSSFILSRDKRVCSMCGKSEGKMDTSHCIPREYLGLRWNPANAVCLCFRCHKTIWHSNPLKAVRWFDGKFGVEHTNFLLSSSLDPFTFSETTFQTIKGELEYSGSLLQ